jgi:putative oxidoreductase
MPLKKLFATDESWAPLFLRIAVAVVIFPHGAQKLLGWFSGPGYSGTVGMFTTQMGLPVVIAVLVIIAEFFGAIGLLFGFLTRIAAIGIGAVMLGAIFLVHLPNGFFMNWTGTQAGEGFQFHLLVLGMCTALFVAGAGRLSVDGWIARRLDQRRTRREHPSGAAIPAH